MSKYAVLGAHLASQPAGRIAMTFHDIEQILGFALPLSAHQYPAWWSNERASHVQARAWMNAGFETEQIDLAGRKVTFRRSLAARRDGALADARAPGTGMAEATQEFKVDKPELKNVDKHPASGALKGTFVILPRQEPLAEGHEEWVEWENAVDRKADLYLERLKGNK